MLVVKQIQCAMLASTCNYSGSPSYNFMDSHGVTPSTGSRPSCDRTCYNYGELGAMRRDCPHPLVLDSMQQLSRVVVTLGIVIMVEVIHKVGEAVISEFLEA